MNWIQTFFAAILVLAMIVCFPLGLIWSLNQLFKTGIEIEETEYNLIQASFTS